MTKHAVVTGASQGLGGLIAYKLRADGFTVCNWDVKCDYAVDVTDRRSVDRAADFLNEITDKLDVLVNCAGINQIMPVPDLDGRCWDQHMNVNARGMLFTVQALLPFLQNGGTVCNIISNASHLPMRYSLAYNASKAAAAMLTKQLARELCGAHKVTVFGVSPNRLKGTPMSDNFDAACARVRGWTAEETEKRQLEAMPIGEETDPLVVAEFIAFLLSTKERHKYLHGSILDYGS